MKSQSVTGKDWNEGWGSWRPSKKLELTLSRGCLMWFFSPFFIEKQSNKWAKLAWKIVQYFFYFHFKHLNKPCHDKSRSIFEIFQNSFLCAPPEMISMIALCRPIAYNKQTVNLLNYFSNRSDQWTDKPSAEFDSGDFHVWGRQSVPLKPKRYCSLGKKKRLSQLAAEKIHLPWNYYKSKKKWNLTLDGSACKGCKSKNTNKIP